MIPVETTQETEHRLRTRSLELSLELTKLMLTSTKITPKADISEVDVAKVAQVFYAYLKGEETKP
jgi:hypothetical protein